MTDDPEVEGVLELSGDALDLIGRASSKYASSEVDADKALVHIVAVGMSAQIALQAAILEKLSNPWLIFEPEDLEAE